MTITTINDASCQITSSLLFLGWFWNIDFLVSLFRSSFTPHERSTSFPKDRISSPKDHKCSFHNLTWHVVFYYMLTPNGPTSKKFQKWFLLGSMRIYWSQTSCVQVENTTNPVYREKMIVGTCVQVNYLFFFFAEECLVLRNNSKNIDKQHSLDISDMKWRSCCKMLSQLSQKTEHSDIF